jgi:hypothetical protein
MAADTDGGRRPTWADRLPGHVRPSHTPLFDSLLTAYPLRMGEDPTYDVALSFAGEQREYVEQVAADLRQHGIRVFYDDYEQVTLWGKDLYAHLDWVYGKASKYCVLFISEEYATKVWTNHERRSAQARALQENREYVLPVRFDGTELPGLQGTIGYIELSRIAPSQLSSMVREKLGPPEKRPEFPRNIGRLLESLSEQPEGRGRGIEDAEAYDIAYSFWDTLGRMTEDERKVVGGVFAIGCWGELPDGVHISLDRLSRFLDLPKVQIVENLGAVRSLNVRARLRPIDAEHGDGELLGDDEDVFVSFWSTRAPASPNASTVAYWAVQTASDHYCVDHGVDAITQRNFSRLAPDPAESIDATPAPSPF